MPLMHQIVAIHKDVASRTGSKFAEINRAVQVKDLMVGQTRTHQPLDDSVPPLPDESSKVQVTVPILTAQLSDALTRLFDVTATRDYGNTRARADVKLPDGTVLIQDAPVDFLIFVEKELAEMTEFAKRIPVQSPSETWHAEGDGTYTSEPRSTRQMAKMPHPLIKWEPPDSSYRQDAQTEVYHTDDHVGNWRTVKHTGAIPPGAHAELLNRLTVLNHAVKFAREEANSITVDNQTFGRGIVDYVFGPLGVLTP